VFRSLPRVLIVSCGCLAIAAPAAHARPAEPVHHEGGLVVQAIATPRPSQLAGDRSIAVAAARSRSEGALGAHATPNHLRDTPAIGVAARSRIEGALGATVTPNHLRDEPASGPAAQPSVTVVATKHGGFNYLDAAIGAVIAAGLIATAGMTATKIRRRGGLALPS
jgi:hypothetical protein